MRAYHFLPARWALDDLENKKLKIATFSDLNDPFELFFFDMSDPALRRGLTETKETLALTRGFLCFSRSWNNPLLWSHYADKHRGICLGFDIPDGTVEPVTYAKNRLEVNVNRLQVLSEEELQKLMKKLLFTKYSGWKYEDEIRVYASLDEKDASTGFYYVEFGENLKLKEIIAGPVCSDESKRKIKEVVESYAESLECIQARLAFRSFKVVRNKRGFSTGQ